jgi:hypothetical protein
MIYYIYIVKRDDTNKLNSSDDAHEDLSKYYKCRSCGMQFDNLGDMQTYIGRAHAERRYYIRKRIEK